VSENTPAEPGVDFIRKIVAEDIASGKHREIVTRFPPEPNGFLHIGHAKAICLNFGIAKENADSRCHLRMDDTDPTKEDMKYVEGIKRDIEWLGFEWGEHMYFASDYYERLYEFAVELIKNGKAYVCHLDEEQMREYRGTVTQAGKNSPDRDRSVDENLELLQKMRDGAFEDGVCTLRAKIDMASPNMKMRDPPIYRIRHETHYRTGDSWCIYPLYDFTHCLSDALEGVTHSLCSLEFENNRELYDWIIDALDTPATPRQIEFARLNLSHTVMSKRRLLKLVEEGKVRGWDDPRMPTISGLRRRGYTPESIRGFAERVGVARAASVVELALLEHAIRDDLNTKTPRVMSVLRPIKVIIDNYPEGQTEEFDVPNFPDDPPKMGNRKVPFSREIWIEEADFMEEPPKKYFRMTPGKEVRLRRAYIVKCESVEKNDDGSIKAVHCTYDPETRGGNAPDGRKIKGTIHWVSAEHAVDAEVRLYETLFSSASPADMEDFVSDLNPSSEEVLSNAKVEPTLANPEAGARYQFERLGYFAVDPDSADGRPVFNRTVPLRDSWAKLMKKQKKG